MPRILHTADWQLGLRIDAVAGERAHRLRDERFRAVERIAALAKTEAVDAVVVAGDVFDDNQVGPEVVQRARDALAAFAPIPVLLLPGNHDAGEPGGVLARLHEGRPALPHVAVLLTPDPVVVGELVFHPCPLLQRRSALDPTAHLPAREPGDAAVRVVIAHGGVSSFGQSETGNLIDLPAVLAKGFDWVALGDWHGRLQVDPRAAYPGTQEPTRFKEADPGWVLLVELSAAGAVPVVRSERVSGTHWHEPDAFDLQGAADVERLDAWLGELSPRASTLVRLHLRGALRPTERARLDAVLAAHAAELLRLDVRSLQIATAFDAEDLASVHAPGFLGEALHALASSEVAEEQEAARLLLGLLAQEAS